MRLICPNCDAQYEIPDDAMLPDGRDVQCSNCEQTWFQEYPAEATGAPRPADPIKPETIAKNTADDANDPAPRPAQDDFTPPAPRRKSLDPSVANVLQQEAQLEAQARKSEKAGSVETQPDLGLGDADGNIDARERAREARGRMARIRDEEPSTPVAETAIADVSRRALLPDIEEINSTLRSNNERSPNDDPGQTAQVELRERRRFSRGFMTMVVLAAVLAVLYIKAPELAQAVPQAEPWITEYVTQVDQGRVWLDDRIEALMVWLDAATASTNS